MSVNDESSERAAATRRRFLAGGATVGAAALFTACGGSSSSTKTAAATSPKAAAASSKLGKKVTIGFSSPGADHGWVAEIGKNAKKAADDWEDVSLLFTEANASSSQQVADIETLINRKPDAIVILPQEGDR
jgi:ribose transport system substrate-binding protein